MVEGPGCTRNGIKMKATIGKTVASAHISSSSTSSSSSSSSSASILNRKIVDTFTVGKELFILFSRVIRKSSLGHDDDEAERSPSRGKDEEEVAMRLHFGMSGTLVVGRGGKSPNIPAWRKNETCSLRLELCDLANEEHVSLCDADGGRNAVADANVVDLTADDDDEDDEGESCPFRNPYTCPPPRSTPRSTPVNPYLKSPPAKSNQPPPKPKNLISMIIEVRGTAVTYVPPTTPRSQLTRLATLDVCGSNFNPHAVFYSLRSTTPEEIISNALLDQNQFPGVGNVIKVECLHNAKIDPRRIVQSLQDDELKVLIHHCREFSMHWLKKSRTPNKKVYNKTNCGTCGKSGVFMQKMGGHNGFMSRVTFWCGVCQPPHSNAVGSTDEGQGFPPPEPNFSQAVVTGASMKRSTPGHHPQPETPVKSPKHSHTQKDSNSATTQQRKTPHPIYSCPEHGPNPIILRRVRKASNNFHRIFRTCKKQSCGYFVWADSHLPNCKCGKKSVLRVSKTERSGGKWFLGCGGGGKKCGFFEWAKEEHLAPLGDRLTPLL